MVSPGAVPGAIIRAGQSHMQGKLGEWKHTGLSGHGRIESLVTVLSSFFMEAQMKNGFKFMQLLETEKDEQKF